MRNIFENLTDAHMRALILFAVENGGGWKDALLHRWTRAAAGPELQQIRNHLGPGWLSEVTFQDLASEAKRRGLYEPRNVD